MRPTPIRRPYVDLRKGPPYPREIYDTNIFFLAATPGTPQYRYRHAIGLKYKVWRLWHLVADFFRSRTPGWWLKVYVLYFIWQLLRATVYSDFMFEEQRRIHEAAPPTQEQMRVLLGGR